MREDLKVVDGVSPDFWRVYNRLRGAYYDDLDGCAGWYADGLRLLERIIYDETVASYGEVD